MEVGYIWRRRKVGERLGGVEGGEICQDVIYERRLKNEWGLRKWEAHGKITFKCWNSLFSAPSNWILLVIFMMGRGT